MMEFLIAIILLICWRFCLIRRRWRQQTLAVLRRKHPNQSTAFLKSWANQQCSNRECLKQALTLSWSCQKSKDHQ